MNDNNNNFSDNEQPILTPEEIEHIKERRRQKQSSEQKDFFFTDFSKPHSENKKTFHVNIPTEEIYDSRDNSFYSNSYRNQNDISFDKFNNAPRERYDHEKYLAENQVDEEPEPHTKPQKKKKRKKKRGCSSKFISLLLILAILIGSCYAYLFYLSLQVKHENLKENYTSGLLRNDEIKNILLLGLDKDSGGTSRSDTMMLLSIDTANNILKITSFLRDTWVTIPGYYNAKLNASYAYGGPQLTVDTIESNFKIDIDHFVLVDFDMFEKIIDSLGGVTVDITENEATFLRNNTAVKNAVTGENSLDGKSALVYSRIRKLDSDFNRTQRQRKVISAIIEKAKKTNPVTLAVMLSEIMPLIETDIGPFEMSQMGFSALKYIHYDIEQLRIPADNEYSSQMISGQSALVPDMESNIRIIDKFIYNTGD